MTEKEQIEVLKSEVEHLKARVASLEMMRWWNHPVWVNPAPASPPAVQPFIPQWTQLICGQQPGMLSTSGH